jgi:hypothetical protein
LRLLFVSCDLCLPFHSATTPKPYCFHRVVGTSILARLALCLPLALTPNVWLFLPSGWNLLLAHLVSCLPLLRFLLVFPAFVPAFSVYFFLCPSHQALLFPPSAWSICTSTSCIVHLLRPAYRTIDYFYREVETLLACSPCILLSTLVFVSFLRFLLVFLRSCFIFLFCHHTKGLLYPPSGWNICSDNLHLYVH